MEARKTKLKAKYILRWSSRWTLKPGFTKNNIWLLKIKSLSKNDVFRQKLTFYKISNIYEYYPQTVTEIEHRSVTISINIRTDLGSYYHITNHINEPHSQTARLGTLLEWRKMIDRPKKPKKERKKATHFWRPEIFDWNFLSLSRTWYRKLTYL